VKIFGRDFVGVRDTASGTLTSCRRISGTLTLQTGGGRSADVAAVSQPKILGTAHFRFKRRGKQTVTVQLTTRGGGSCRALAVTTSRR
jgi:hypothetical protein